jgi:hypothetical protein
MYLSRVGMCALGCMYEGQGKTQNSGSKFDADVGKRN